MVEAPRYGLDRKEGLNGAKFMKGTTAGERRPEWDPAVCHFKLNRVVELVQCQAVLSFQGLGNNGIVIG